MLKTIWNCITDCHFWFGVVIPFIGWQQMECFEDGTVALDEETADGELIPVPEHLKTHTCSYFTLEWLTFGIGWQWDEPKPKKKNVKPTK